LRGHLALRVPVSDLCDEHRLHPTLLCQWQKAFIEKRAAAFEIGADESGRSGARSIRNGRHPPIEANGLAEASEKGGAHHGDRPWGIVVMSASADPVAGEPTDRCADSELELVEDDVHLITHWALEALSNVECILLDDRSSRGGADSRHESAPLSCQKPIGLS
jgi:hypothetical protein